MRPTYKVADLDPLCRARRVSFIVPSFNASSTLRATVDSIRCAARDLDHEIVIVDDGSTDRSRELGAALSDVFVGRPVQGGAARARNDGVAKSCGAVLVFVDSDVTVDRAAVEGIVGLVEGDFDAAFGAYTPLPPAGVGGAATVYKNLVHHYTHTKSARRPTTFWSGFGAVRRQAFEHVGGFDATVTKSADIEDIQLGYRLTKAGFAIALDPTLQVQHHKQYSLSHMVSSDLVHRAIPWTRTMLERRVIERSLNLSGGWLASAVLTWSAAALVVASATPVLPAATGLLCAGGAVAAWALVNRGFLAQSVRVCGWRSVGRISMLHGLATFYAPIGAVLGFGVFFLRRANSSIRNTLPSDLLITGDSKLDVTVAVVANGLDEGAEIAHMLPPRADWWELIVAAETRPSWLPDEDRFIEVPASASHHERLQAVLLAARGKVFANVGTYLLPSPGWLQAVRDVADSGDLAVCGAIGPVRQGLRRRAGATARWWELRPTQPRGWRLNHSPGNSVFRTDAARQLGGFAEPNALPYRLTAFGAQPFRFEPNVLAMPNPAARRMKLRGLYAIGRLEAACTVRYFDNGVALQICRAGVAPAGAAWRVISMVIQAVREHSADLRFWMALPLTSAGVAAYHLGWAVGALRPAELGGRVPTGPDDLAELDLMTSAPVSASFDPGPAADTALEGV